MDGKHTCSDKEKLAFVGFMEELVVEEQRVDAGQFKPSIFVKLAAKMNEKFPGCGLNAKHCKNKHKPLKEKYQSATEMLTCSGFGWSDEKQCAEVDSKQVLDIWLRQHPHKFYTPGKAFPFFSCLEAIFEKDKANGNYAMNGNDTDKQLQADDKVQMGLKDVDMFDNSESPLQASALIVSSTEKIQGRNTSSSKKRKDVEILKHLVESIRYAMNQQGKHVEVLPKAMAGVNGEVTVG